ncbi:MAG: ERCC4-type nuclease [Natronomonas sp.]|jgi:ERCC4-type nuclease
MNETRHSSAIPTTVLRDAREQRPWTFDGCAVEARDLTLSTGDYAVLTDCTHDPDDDTYHPQLEVERKSGQDFLTALTWDRDRFRSELRRAAEWPQPLAVIVETSWETLLRNRGCMS